MAKDGLLQPAMLSERLTVFYSWQSDTPARWNREFIEKALRAALDQLKADLTLEPALRDSIVGLDKDTAGVAGSPPIAQTILNKIEMCTVFVADLTFVGESLKSLRRIDRQKRLLPNPNVLLEYGYALQARGHERLIAVMNTAFGTPANENLPFDLRHVRWPITFALSAAENAGEAAVLGELTTALAKELRLILAAQRDVPDERFLPHPSTTDPSSFFTSAEELVAEGPFGHSIEVSSVPNQGRAYLRLFPVHVAPLLDPSWRPSSWRLGAVYGLWEETSKAGIIAETPSVQSATLRQWRASSTISRNYFRRASFGESTPWRSTRNDARSLRRQRLAGSS